VADPQMMWCAHASSPQTTRHGMLGGHCTSPASQLPVALQSTTQTPAASHVPFVHPSSHSATSDESGVELPSGRTCGCASGASGSSQLPWPGIAHQPALHC
jgi:hypothetical protein